MKPIFKSNHPNVGFGTFRGGVVGGLGSSPSLQSANRFAEYVLVAASGQTTSFVSSNQVPR